MDESYTSDHFRLGAVVVNASAATTIERGLDAVMHAYAGHFGLEVATELHGHPLFQGVGDWENVPTRVRINVYERSMKVIAASGARVLLRAMDVKRQRQRYPRPDPPHEIVLGHLLEQLDAHATSRSAHVLILADEVHNKERHRTNFRDYRVDETPGYRSSTLPRILDTIHFAPSDHSRLLQAADLITFMRRRRATHVEPDGRAQAANDRIWAPMIPAIEHDGCWVP